IPLAESCRCLGEQAQADFPLFVKRNRAEAIGRERLKLATCLRCRAQLDQHVRENAEPYRVGDVFCRREAHKLLHFTRTTLLTTKQVHLKSVGYACTPALGVLALGAGLSDETLSFLEPSFEQCQDRLVCTHEPGLARLAKLGC